MKPAPGAPGSRAIALNCRESGRAAQSIDCLFCPAERIGGGRSRKTRAAPPQKDGAPGKSKNIAEEAALMNDGIVLKWDPI